jgi:hypothetical protein
MRYQCVSCSLATPVFEIELLRRFIVKISILGVLIFLSTTARQAFAGTLLAYAAGANQPGLYEVDVVDLSVSFLTEIVPTPSSGSIGYLDGDLYFTNYMAIYPGQSLMYYGIGDPSTGVFTPISIQPSGNWSSGNWYGFAPSADNTFFYTVDYNNSLLLKVTPGGPIETVGSSLGLDFRSLALDRERNILYASTYYDGVPDLYAINVGTGIATLIGSLGFSPASYGGDVPLYYDNTAEILYASNSIDRALFSVNTADGSASLIGYHGLPIGALSMLPTAVPGAGSLPVLAWALFALGLTVRWRKINSFGETLTAAT